MKWKRYQSNTIKFSSFQFFKLKFNLFYQNKRELIIQTINSSKLRTISGDASNSLLELTRLLVQKQNELTNYVNIGKLNSISYLLKVNKLYYYYYYY
jgi:hypothetical protein